MKKDILCKPFSADQIRQRPGQHGKTLSYVETHAVIARLNEGCDAWSFEIVKHEVLADEVIVVGKLVADGVVKMAFGGSSVTKDASGREVSLADDLKSAASDCLKKCASLLGVALELYGGAPAGPSAAPASTAMATGNDARPGFHARRPDFGDRLTSRQLSAIQAVARRKGLSPASVTAMVGERWGKEGAQHLSRKEASDFISELSGTNGAHA